MELKFDSGLDGAFRKDKGSGLDIEDGADIGFDAMIGSVVDCINAAMEAEGFAPASRGGRTKAMATWEVMVRWEGTFGGEE